MFFYKTNTNNTLIKEKKSDAVNTNCFQSSFLRDCFYNFYLSCRKEKVTELSIKSEINVASCILQ